MLHLIYRNQLLPIGVFEAKGFGVFRDGAFGLVFCAVGECGLNLDADFYLCIGVGNENGDDFLGDLDEAHFRGGGVDRDIAVKRLRLGRANVFHAGKLTR